MKWYDWASLVSMSIVIAILLTPYHWYKYSEWQINGGREEILKVKKGR